jgi:predicted short-subunit dehydrogenase-like oxidoreductase (DUF2520 family)
MNIVLIGTGNVATVLGRKLKAAGHKIVQVYGRNFSTADKLADELGAVSCAYWSVINTEADLYIIAVTDNVLTDLHRSFKLKDQLVVHTAGSVSKEVLAKVSTQYGVLYPLQSLRKEMTVFPEIPLLIDGNTDTVKALLFAVADSISGKVKVADDAYRQHLHLAAVIAGNFTNHLYAVAADYCQQTGVDFNLLKPLIIETANRLTQFSPQEMQTGPAIRNDMPTIQLHLSLLENNPALRELYATMTARIKEMAVIKG